jgi:parallel beta-helix repeat protein
MRDKDFYIAIVAMAICMVLALVVIANAGTCGGATACSCGDDVITSTTLTGNLVCGTTSHGLNVAANGVTIDCASFSLSRSPTWTNGSTDRYGIYVNGVTGTLIKNCTVGPGWRNGVRVKAASGITIQNSTVSTNGDSTAHVGYGIEVTQGSSTVAIYTVTVQSNGDEGIHVSDGSAATITSSTVTNNFREQIYVLAATVTLTGGTYGGTGTTGFYVKDSSNCSFSSATVDKQVRVTGASNNNLFTGLTMTGGMRIDYYQPSSGPVRFPTNNTFSGGSVSHTTDCINLDSSTNTLIDGVTIGTCTAAKPIVASSTYGDCSMTFANMTQPDLSGAADCTIAVAQNWTVHVQDGGAVAIEGAQVAIKDRFADAVNQLTTDASGNVTFPAVVVSRGKNALSKLTPHWLAVDNDAFFSNRQRVSVGPAQSTTVTLSAQ